MRAHWSVDELVHSPIVDVCLPVFAEMLSLDGLRLVFVRTWSVESRKRYVGARKQLMSRL